MASPGRTPMRNRRCNGARTMADTANDTPISANTPANCQARNAAPSVSSTSAALRAMVL